MVREPKRRLYHLESTRTSKQTSAGIYIVKHRFRNSMEDVQTLHGADIDFDHNLLLAKICTRLKKIVRFRRGKPTWDVQKLYAQ